MIFLISDEAIKNGETG
jgi:FtsZ-interacting cell division protein YlmF